MVRSVFGVRIMKEAARDWSSMELYLQINDRNHGETFEANRMEANGQGWISPLLCTGSTEGKIRKLMRLAAKVEELW